MKKTAASEPAAPPRAADYSKAFLKDWQRLSHSRRFALVRFKEAMMLLIANDAPLGPEWLDHPLNLENAVDRSKPAGNPDVP